MSYPDLGCFAECLTCELCDDPFNFDDDDVIDLFDFDDDFDPDPFGDPDFWNPDPEDGDEGGPFDGFPTGVPVGDGEISPTWNDGPGVGWGGQF